MTPITVYTDYVISRFPTYIDFIDPIRIKFYKDYGAIFLTFLLLVTSPLFFLKLFRFD